MRARSGGTTDFYCDDGSEVGSGSATLEAGTAGADRLCADGNAPLFGK